ncbi:MAG: methionine gamma-lyase family protein [Eubacteriales bacterium]|nr:methionine gamma-lyase family protein [Eubacteriales bacterium]
MIKAAFAPFGISPLVVEQSERILETLAPVFTQIDQTRSINQLRVLKAFHDARLAESSLGGSTGYGYDDSGRAQIEAAYAAVFGAEKALVRIQISAGTQALAICLYGLLRPNDELLAVTGRPYDTLQATIGLAAPGEPVVEGSLLDLGVRYRELELLPNGDPDVLAIAAAINDQTKVVFIQKSRGYTTRRSLLIDDIAQIVKTVRDKKSDAIILVDNCYGEFVETREPCMVGADLVAGSLIKNPGGGICPSGGYVAGRADLVEKVAARLTAPGLGSHVGPTLGFSRLIAQGFYLAPQIVAESLKGAVFAAALFRQAGYKTYPAFDEPRGDLVQTLEFNDPDRLVAFCQAIQAASPVDSFVRPEPWAMPGYDSPVIMAAGAFVQGSSIELSADGPLKPPYPAYLQGGLNFETVRLACLVALQRMQEQKP